MARLMFVLGNHEPTRGVLQTLELATAACAAGGEVVLYLHGDAAYLVDPERFMRIDKPYQGFESPLGMVRQARAVGVQFWFASRALDYLALEAPEGTFVVSADQLAQVWADFDQVITL